MTRTCNEAPSGSVLTRRVSKSIPIFFLKGSIFARETREIATNVTFR